MRLTLFCLIRHGAKSTTIGFTNKENRSQNKVATFHHLRHLPVDFVKIDGQFVRGMVQNPADRAIVMSINDIAHSLGKRTVAEFVENREILELLIECGVDYAQGNYISLPRANIIWPDSGKQG